MNHTIISGGKLKGLSAAVIFMLSAVNAQADSFASGGSAASVGAVFIFPAASVQALVMTASDRLHGDVESIGPSGRAMIVLRSASQTVGGSVRFAIDQLPTSAALTAGASVQITPVSAVAGSPVLGHMLSVDGEFSFYIPGDDEALQLRSRQVDA